jgi:hypothetical protein
MKTVRFHAILAAALLLQTIVSASVIKRSKPDPTTFDGRAFNGILWESSESRKIELLEHFDKQFPNSEWRANAYSLLEDMYVSRKEPDKALETGDKLLALDPDDLATAHKNQQIAASKGDNERAKKYGDIAISIALRVARTPDADEDPSRVELAKAVVAEREYQLYDQAFRAKEPRDKIQLLDDLLAFSPKSQYLDQAHLLYFAAYRQSNQNGKALAMAELMNSSGQFYPDVMLYTADYQLRVQKDAKQAVANCEKLVRAMESGRQPADFDAAEWPRQKAFFASQARMIEFYSYKQLGQPANAIVAADSIIAGGGASPDILMFAADYYFKADRNAKKVSEYSEQLLRAIGEGKKPGGMSDADWDRQKDVYTEVACYMIGSLQMEAGSFIAAGETLRQAWAIAKRTQYLLPAVTAVLAATDQHIQKYAEAALLYKECLQFGGTYREQAQRSLLALKNEHGIQ